MCFLTNFIQRSNPQHITQAATATNAVIVEQSSKFHASMSKIIQLTIALEAADINIASLLASIGQARKDRENIHRQIDENQEIVNASVTQLKNMRAY